MEPLETLIDRLRTEAEVAGATIYNILHREAGWAIQWWEEGRCTTPMPQPLKPGEGAAAFRESCDRIATALQARMVEGLVLYFYRPSLREAVEAELARLSVPPRELEHFRAVRDRPCGEKVPVRVSGIPGSERVDFRAYGPEGGLRFSIWTSSPGTYATERQVLQDRLDRGELGYVDVGSADACVPYERMVPRGMDPAPAVLPGDVQSHRGAQLGKTPSGNHSLPLTQREHGALTRLLDGYLSDWQREEDSEADLRALRAIRARMQRS